MRLGKTTAIHFASQAALSVAGFVATFAIARELGPGVLGVYAIAVALIAWLNVPAAAVGSAINKRVSEGEDRGAYLSAGVLWNAAIALVVAAVVLVFRDRVDAYVGEPVSALIAVLVVGDIAFKSVFSALSGQKKVAHVGVLQAVERVFRTVAQIGLILVGYRVAGLLFGHVVSLFLAAVVGVLLFEVRPSLPTREHLGRIYEYARYAWLGVLDGRVFAWMDTVILAFFVGPALVGIYEVSWSLASVLGLASISIRNTLFPELSELGVRDEYDRIRHYLDEGLVFAGVFLIPGLFGAAVVGPQLLKIYRPEFMEGALVLVILVVARLFGVYTGQFRNAINAIDRPDVTFRINLVFIGSNLVLNVTLIYLYGWHGAAVATATSMFVALVLSYYFLDALVDGLSIPYREIGHQVVAGAVMAVVVLGLEPTVPNDHYATVALVLAGGAVYGGVLVAISTRIRRKAVSLLPAAVSG